MIEFKTKVVEPGTGWYDRRIKLLQDALPVVQSFAHQRILHKLITELTTKHKIRLITYLVHGQLRAELHRYDSQGPSDCVFAITTKTPTGVADAITSTLKQLTEPNPVGISKYRLEDGIVKTIHQDELTAEEFKQAVTLTIAELRAQADALERGEYTHG